MKESHILLTSLGILGTSPRDFPYRMADKTFSAKLSPIALFNLLPEEERFGRLVALCTEDALRDTFPILKDGLPIFCQPVKIPEGNDDQELSLIVHKILDSIPANSELTLDLTHGLRPIPFLFFTSCLYLQALKGVRIRKAWYGKLEKDKPSPFVDVSGLLNMVEWFQAVHSFKELRNPEALADRMKQIDPGRSDEKKFRKLYSDFVKYLDDFACFFGAGLPLELGRSSSELHRIHSEMEERYAESEIPIPLAEDLMDEITRAATPFRLSIKKAREDWKQKLFLSPAEISRQARLIDRYFSGGFYNNALGLLREFVITRAMMSSSHKDDWLEPDSRWHMERGLGALKDYWMKNRDALPERQKLLASFWDELTQGRNELHHHGMRNENVKVTKRAQSLRRRWTTLKDHLEDEVFWRVEFGGGSGILLVTPLGFFPGFLYTALVRLKPEQCLVVASRQSEIRLDEIKARSGYQGLLAPKILDAYHGFADISRLVSDSDEIILGADRVFCNLTGGTTALQYAVIQLADLAVRRGRDTTWIAIVDDRMEEEQKAEPYILGEMVEMKKAVRL